MMGLRVLFVIFSVATPPAAVSLTWGEVGNEVVEYVINSADSMIAMFETYATKDAELRADVKSLKHEQIMEMNKDAKDVLKDVGTAVKDFYEWHPAMLECDAECVRDNNYDKPLSALRKIKLALTFVSEGLIKYRKSYTDAPGKLQQLKEQAMSYTRNTEWAAIQFEGFGRLALTTTGGMTGYHTYSIAKRTAGYYNHYAEQFRRSHDSLERTQRTTKRRALALNGIYGTVLKIVRYLDDIKVDLECGRKCFEYAKRTLAGKLIKLYKKLGKQHDKCANKF